LGITGELKKHESHGCFPGVFVDLEFPALPFVFQNDRFYGATIFQASSVFFQKHQSPAPKTPEATKLPGLFSREVHFRRTQNMAKNMYQKVCD